MAVDGSHLDWASHGNFQPGSGTISEANLDGTGAQSVVKGQNNPTGVAVNASHLYWTGSGDGTVNQANLDGTGQQALVTAQTDPEWVAVSGRTWTGRAMLWAPSSRPTSTATASRPPSPVRETWKGWREPGQRLTRPARVPRSPGPGPGGSDEPGVGPDPLAEGAYGRVIRGFSEAAGRVRKGAASCRCLA